MESRKADTFDGWEFLTDSQTVQEVLERWGVPKGYDITAVMVDFDNDGNIVDIWATESAKPYLISCEYLPIDYWKL